MRIAPISVFYVGREVLALEAVITRTPSVGIEVRTSRDKRVVILKAEFGKLEARDFEMH